MRLTSLIIAVLALGGCVAKISPVPQPDLGDYPATRKSLIVSTTRYSGTSALPLRIRMRANPLLQHQVIGGLETMA